MFPSTNILFTRGFRLLLFGRAGERNSRNRMWFNMLNDRLCCVTLLGKRIWGFVDDLVYLLVKTFQASFGSNIRPLLSTSPKLLLIERLLLVGMSQGITSPRLSFAVSCPALETGHEAQRAEGRDPASRSQEAACVWLTVELILFCFRADRILLLLAKPRFGSFRKGTCSGVPGKLELQPLVLGHIHRIELDGFELSRHRRRNSLSFKVDCSPEWKSIKRKSYRHISGLRFICLNAGPCIWGWVTPHS